MAQRPFDFPRLSEIKDKKGYKIHIVIYVPSTIHVTTKISDLKFQERITETIRFLRKTLGASTTVRAIGNYKSTEHGSVTENVAKVEAFTNTDDYQATDIKIRNWLKNKKKEWDQESIGYEFEEQFFLVK